ncbi:hypothetical protein LTS14_008234 [Recurvomyces mirabilis]|uniref:uncharacterized protein n=1 Tax=Recurvomyces mirabilis TaxID=574656 RepID=UPI002DDFFB55|nr:hypothetical protein LTS14_008234 [Recurvomyces mirabilis]
MSLVFLFFLLPSCYAYETVSINITQPQTHAPLNTALAYYKLAGFNGDDDYLTRGFYQTTCGSNFSFHYTEPSVWGNETGTRNKFILILTHGYPESSYIWRRVTSVSSSRLPVIVPDQPGCGLSTPYCNETGCAYDKRTYSRAIFKAVKHIYPGHGENATTSVVLAGDDCGGRLCIVPRWKMTILVSTPWACSSPTSFPLWRRNFATDVIMAYGGGKWVDQILEYRSGESVQGIALFKADEAWQSYHTLFEQLAATNRSVFEYQAGGTIGYDWMAEDQKNDRKVDIPTHVLLSEVNLGAQFDVLAVWTEYVHPSAGLTLSGIGEQNGHLIIEEAPGELYWNSRCLIP